MHHSILTREFLGGLWLAIPPRALASRLIIPGPVPSWIGSRSTPSVRAAEVLVGALEFAGREIDREAFIKPMQNLSLDGGGGSSPMSFGGGRGIGFRGAAILTIGRRGSLARVDLRQGRSRTGGR